MRACALVLLLAGCGGGASSDFSRLSAGAERAYAAGRYGEAAAAWEKAEARAERTPDRDEARYRRAASLRKARRTSDAVQVLDRLLRESPEGDRAARALLDRAEIELDAGDEPSTMRDLDALVRSHPESGLAKGALGRYLALVRSSGEAETRSYLEARIAALAGTELGEYLYAALAESLERSGDLRGARARYLLLAEKYPYPRGSLWDDALFHAAELSVTLGEPEDAIRLLTRMLGERESAYVQGSYERGRYAQAQFRIAELYRDALHDGARARAAFERLWSAHRTSRLRDDAAWQAATLAVAAGDAAGACRDLKALVEELPTSRYAACAPRLCPDLGKDGANGGCHEYLLRANPAAER